LPLYSVLHTDRQGKTHQRFFYDEREYDEFVNRLQGQLRAFGEELEIIEADDYEGLARAKGAPNTLRPRKFHEALRSAQILSEIERYGIPLDSLVPSSGEEPPSVKFSIISNGEIVNVDALPEVVPAVKQLGRKGLEIERFKGLGEMDADELAETTLQPESRTMVQVTIGDAIMADKYFSILAGKDVTKRREFIERHALEAHNLDV
jgi:DNA gyrase subunit B